ncbi:MAG TPA: 2Fe-2S iron-sulfur cluster-binding protein, partial [Streptosporangiaceae bacterium]
MSSPMRLGPQPGEVINRSAPVSFRWNGRAAAGYAGDTVISALAAAGERVFSRSFKYHRPRGLLTADYLDPGCTVQVGDEPNVRGAHRLVADGMDVRAQNAWPSLRVDVKAANQLVQAFLPPGFYYKTFIRPQRLWPAYDRVLRRFSAGGVVGNEVAGERYDKRHAHPDVLVAGGGPTGMQAALAAARAGARVLLVEQEHQVGGHLRWGTDAERAVLAELGAAVAAEDAIEVLTDSVVIGRYDANLVAVVQRGLPDVFERLIKARAGVLVVAAGLIERPYVIAGNDLPGVMLSTAVRRLIAMYAVKPGERAVVLTANESGDAAVADLGLAGVEVVHIADARRADDVVRVRGRGGVQSVELAGGERIPCDLFVTATGWTAPLSLLTMAGGHPVYQPKAARYVPDFASLPDD